jgi:hypothetical protein
VLTANNSLYNNVVTKCHIRPRAWTDSLEERLKQRKTDMRFHRRSMYSAGAKYQNISWI